MRQVPHILIVGDGKMATHFGHYLSLLGISCCQWSRNRHSTIPLPTLFGNASVTVLLISDDSLLEFIEAHPYLKNKSLVHFSGAMAIPGTLSAHPLMSFSHHLYDLETYQSVPFIIEQGQENTLAFLPNEFYSLPIEMKTYYHMLCVLSGNFTSILWHKFFSECEQRFQFPKKIGEPYLKKITQNILQNADCGLTGPLVRNDINTINHHLETLENDEFKTIYQAFVTLFQSKETT